MLPPACLPPAGDDLVSLVLLVLDNASVAAESAELAQCLGLWRRLQEQGGELTRLLPLPPLCCAAHSLWVACNLNTSSHLPVAAACCLLPAGERWSADWAQLALAAADNTSLCLEHYADGLAGCASALPPLLALPPHPVSCPPPPLH